MAALLTLVMLPGMAWTEDGEGPATCLVTFNVEGALAVVEVAVGTPVVQPEDPAAEGLLFSHWAMAGDIEAAPYAFDLPVLADMELIARFVSMALEEEVEAPEATETEPGTMPDTAEPIVETHAEAAPVEIIPDPAEPEIVATAPRYVDVWLDPGKGLRVGDSVTLHGLLTGYGGQTYTLQWQYEADGGWYDAAGANGMAHTVVIGPEGAGLRWRLAVWPADVQ